MDRHRSDNTRTVLPRHPPEERRERVRRAAASHIKPYYLRPPSLRPDFGDEYAHFAWGSDLGLAVDSTLASPLYTLVDRCTIQLPNGPGSGDAADAISTIPSQGLSQKVNARTAFHPCSWTSFTPCGSCTNHPTIGPDPLQSHQAVNASQLKGHTPCWRYPSGLWFGGTSSTNKEGSNVAGPKSMTAKLPTGGSGARMETGKS